MVSLGDDYLKEKRGWSQRKVDILRLGLIIGLYIFFIYIAFNMVWTDQQCRYLLPNNQIATINLTDPQLPQLNDFLVSVNLTDCHKELHCSEVWVCNLSNNPVEDPSCWTGIC